MIRFRSDYLSISVSSLLLLWTSSVSAVDVDVSGVGLYAQSGSVTLNNMSSVSIAGTVRSQNSTCTINNVSSYSISGDVIGSGEVKFNNSTGSVSGVANSLTKVTVTRGSTIWGGATVVSSIGSYTLKQAAAPTSTSDPNYVGPITIVTGDYTINSSLSINGTIYATGDIHINNGNISGNGALVAGGSIHLNNISSMGATNSKIFVYSINGGIDANNISSATIWGTLYAPRGEIKLDNVSTLVVKGGIIGDTLRLNNISSATVGSGSFTSTVQPPGINPTPVASNPCDVNICF